MTTEEYFERQKRRSKGVTTLTDYRRDKKNSLSQTIGFDTFEADLNSMGTTIQGISDNWQTEETMNKTRSSVEDMQARINAYQEYQKIFGGADLSELANGYKSALKDWDNLTNLYKQYDDAESYTKEKTKISELNAMSMEDIEPYLKDKKKSIAYTTIGGQDITWQSLYDEKKHKKMSTSKEGELGYEEFVKAEKEAKEKAEKEEAEKSWFVKAVEMMGSTPDTTLPGSEINVVIDNKRKDNSYQKPNEDWTQEELNTFGAYWYEKDYEGAYDYAAKVNNEKALKEKNTTKEKISSSATSGFGAGVGHWAGSILTAPFGLVDYLDDLTDIAAGRDVIVEEGIVTPFEYSQTVNSSQSTAINDWSGTLNDNIPVIGGKGLGDVYGLGTSVAQSALSAYALGPAGTAVSYFGQSAASGVDDALSRGATPEQALIYGGIAGSAEAVSEYIGADRLLNIGSSGIKNAFFEVLKQSGAEGIEETFSATVENIADNFVMQDKSAFNIKMRQYISQGLSEEEAIKKAWTETVSEIAYNGLSGFVSGGLHSVAPVAIGKVRENSNAKKTGANIRSNERVNEMLEVAGMTPQESDAYNLYTKYAKKGINADNVSDLQLGRLYDMTSNQAMETVNSKKTSVEQKSEAIKTLGKLSKVNTENKAVKLSQELTKNGVAEENSVTSSGEKIDIAGIKLGEDAKVVTADGKEISLSDITPTQRDADLLSHAQLMSENDANLFIELYDGQTDVSEYVDSFNLVKAYSEQEGAYFQDIALENKGVLSTSQVQAIYNATVHTQYVEHDNKIKAISEKQGKTMFIKGTFDDSVIDYKGTNADGSKVSWKDLEPQQRSAIKFAQLFSKATGVNIKLIKSEVKYGKHKGKNGSYYPATNTIEIDVFAGRINAKAVNDSIIPTLSHEITHWMKYKAAAVYDSIRNDVLNTLVEASKDYNNSIELVQAEMLRIKKNHPEIEVTEEYAIDELVARACEDMLSNSKTAKELLAKMDVSEQQSFIEKVKETFENLIQWVNDLLAQYKSTSAEAETLRNYKEMLEKISKQWDEMLQQSIQANQALQKEGITGEELANKTSNNVQEMARDRYWYPNMSKSDIAYVRRIAKYELPKTDNYLDENTKWLYNVKNGNTYFALYSTAHEDNPTVLYACKGNQAKNEYAWFVRFIETLRSVDNGNYEQSSRVLNQMLEAFWDGYGSNNRHIGDGLGRRSNGRDVRTTNQRTDFRPSEALFNCLRNIAKTQKQNEQNRLEQYSDRDTLESRYSELQTEYTQLEKEAEALKQSEAYLNFLDSISLLQGEELDKAVKEYGEWTRKSGLYDMSKRMSEIIGEQKDIRAALDNEKELSRDAYMKSIENLTEKEKMDFVNKAVKRFGTTNRLNLASYLMLNGKMLDFSEGQGYRVQDHREISEILDMPETTGYSDGLIAFMNMGNIRLQTYGIDISQAPNQAQKSALRDIISQIMRNEDEFNVDFSKTNGYTDGSVTYPKGTATSKILADIDSYFETGVVPEYESSIAEFRYSDRETDIETQINQSMTMAECKDMIQRAFVLGGIYDWYDGEYKNGDEWLKAQGADEVALYIENEYALQQKYIDKIQGVIDDEFYVADILEAYLKGTLIGNEKPKTKRLDLSVNHRINDTRFYSPQRIENVKQLFEVASQKLTSKNRAEVSNARAKILLFAHNKGASELLGLTQAELNKKLRTWGGYPANARDMSRRFNNGVADSNKWTGIENCSWLYRSTVTTDELESLVKSVTGAADDYEKLYIARTMLALDTHIDWSWISFEFDSHANINKNRNKNDRCNGFYSNDKRKVVVSHNMPNTVAHEMGHALDYQWGRDLGYQYDALTEVSQNTQRITDPQTKQFFDNFKIFMDSLTDNGDIRSEYTQNPKEVFARFIARFVEWVDNTGTGNHSYRTESMYYNDKFTAANYIEFVKLLQEKAMLDSKKVAEGEDVKFSDRDIEVYDRTAILKETTIDKYLRDYASKTSPNYAQAYITYMSPDRFLKMTTSYRDNIEAQSKEFNYDEFTEATLFQPIQLIIDSETGEVIGHEGRHRMVALSNAGVYNVPVLMFDYSNKTNKESISEMVLHGQFNSYLTTRVEDVIPFSYSNREEIIKNFGTQSSWQKMKERYDGEKTLMYSDRDNVSVYDTMGETDRLIKENEQLREDVERLKERLKLERQITNGNHFNENQLNAVAAHIRNIAKSNYSKTDLVNLLKGVYSYIATSKELNWDDLFSQAYDVASMVLSEAKPVTETNEYYKWILNDIRGTKISVNEQQIQNARYKLGNRWRNSFFNKVKITDNAISLDRQWQSWANDYPDLFDAEISDADMLVELYDIYDSVREGSELVVEYDTEEQTRWLAREIYNQYWNVSPIRTTAEKYTKQIKLLNYKHRESMNQLRSNYEDRLKTQHKADRQKAIKLVKEIRERKDKEIAEVKKHSKERMDAYKESAERKTVIQSILSTTTSLNKKLLTNSKETHIPESLKPVVISLINTLDFSSKQLLGMSGTRKNRRGTPSKSDIVMEERFSKAREMADEEISLSEAINKASVMFSKGNNMLLSSEAEDHLSLVSLDLDLIDKIVGTENKDGLITTISILEKKFGNDFVLQKMSLEDLKTLNAMVKSISHWASQVDKALAISHKEGIANLGRQTVTENDALGKYNERGEVSEGIKKFLSWSNLLPINAFERMGIAAQKVFEALQDAQDTLTFNQAEIEKFTEELFKGKEKDIKKWREDVKSFDLVLPDGTKKTVKMPVSFVMTLHCVSKQEDALRHLVGEIFAMDKDGNPIKRGKGMTIAGFKEKGKMSRDLDNTILTEKLIKQITSVLTKDQIFIADKLQEFMNTTGSNWGDMVSMALYGIKKFGIKDYFPIAVTPSSISDLNTDDKKSTNFFAILNYGFTKSRNPQANQSIEIGDIFDIFSNHITMMAIYNAYALPIYDMARWYNFKETVDGKERGVVKSLQNAFGKEATSYIKRLVNDLNGQHASSRLGIIDRIFKNTKVSMVGNSLSVALLQPTAYLKASTIIPSKYLLKSALYVKDFGVKKGVKKAQTYCGIALRKSQGYFEMGVSKNTTTRILHDETKRDKLIEWSLKGAEWMDEKTWGLLWNACEFEVRATHKNLKVGSKEFYDVVAKRLREVIYKTQVVDSPLTKSDVMRSPDGLAKSITMFASENTVAYNMVSEAFVKANLDKRKYGKKEAWKRNHKNIRKNLLAYTFTSMVTSLLQTAVSAFRDDDDEEKDFEEYLKLWLTNFALDWAIVGKIPYIKEIINYAQGYSSSRVDTMGLENAVLTVTNLIKAVSGESESASRRTIEYALKTLSNWFGVAAYNQYRDLMASLDTLGILSVEEFEEMLNDLFGIDTE